MIIWPTSKSPVPHSNQVWQRPKQRSPYARSPKSHRMFSLQIPALLPQTRSLLTSNYIETSNSPRMAKNRINNRLISKRNLGGKIQIFQLNRKSKILICIKRSSMMKWWRTILFQKTRRNSGKQPLKNEKVGLRRSYQLRPIPSSTETKLNKAK